MKERIQFVKIGFTCIYISIFLHAVNLGSYPTMHLWSFLWMAYENV